MFFRAIPVKPMIAFSGVLISWDILNRNEVFVLSTCSRFLLILLFARAFISMPASRITAIITRSAKATIALIISLKALPAASVTCSFLITKARDQLLTSRGVEQK